MTPEVLLIGDSHTIALEDGAKALGIATEAFRIGGAGWHEGKFAWGSDGIVPRASPMGRNAIEAIRARHGVTNILHLGVPVLTTVGFHLGSLTRGLRWNNHVVLGSDGVAPEQGILVTESFLTRYIQSLRTQHLRVLRRMAREAQVIVVPPPPLGLDLNGRSARAIVISLMQKAGLTIFDPMQELLSGETDLPDRFFDAEDPNHANAAFGKLVMETLRARGLI
ncbi:hypothetical protein [Rhodobacter maris]|uniref:GDSL-like lipase/acylhydrolase family protein n=1 Tax=Rhodobacter maris TaxID=446682 RepID=A0A285SKI2_9RHOB|nr:hypothetical protein [Rhodobacter maris]SOC06488.1 hypothetical protein SAMN05877831_10531 [Rhodobacter maris]